MGFSFFLWGPWDFEGGSTRWGRLPRTPRAARGLWADGISGSSHCGQEASPVPCSLGPRVWRLCGGPASGCQESRGLGGTGWQGSWAGAPRTPGSCEPAACPQCPYAAAPGSGLPATQRQQKNLRALPRVPSRPAHPGRKEVGFYFLFFF